MSPTMLGTVAGQVMGTAGYMLGRKVAIKVLPQEFASDPDGFPSEPPASHQPAATPRRRPQRKGAADLAQLQDDIAAGVGVSIADGRPAISLNRLRTPGWGGVGDSREGGRMQTQVPEARRK